MPDTQVIVLGDYFCDMIITGLPDVPRLGADLFGEHLEICPGGAFICTTALTRLGVRTAWLANLGTDMLSRFIIEAARQEGLDESLFRLHDFPLRSLSLSFSFSTDRGFISYVDPVPGSFPLEAFEQRRPAWAINLPFGGSSEDLEAIRAVRALGCRVFTDCQYVDFDLDRPGIAETLRLADIFAPNESEALRLTGACDAETALEVLAGLTPLVVIKRGARGAIARRGGQTWCAPGLPVEVVDTTGAGDCFNAGFLAALLAGHPVERCLQWGNICGGLSTTRRGGTAAATTPETIHAILA